MPIIELKPEELLRRCDPASFDFETTAELPVAAGRIIGQPRGTRAIEFGLDMEGPGYNIFVLGENGTGRMTAIQHFLARRAAAKPVPPDWAYVHNFADARKPRALSFPPGTANRFAGDMARLVEQLKAALPRTFGQEEQVIAALAGPLVEDLKARYAGQPQVEAYLEEVRQDIGKHLALFQPANGAPPASAFRRFTVNVLVDHAGSNGAPVVVESFPAIYRLVGSVEREPSAGGAPDFTLIRPGSLLQANGGYLVLRADDVWNDDFAWEALKQAVRDGRVRPEELSERGPQLASNALEPEPIPLNVKVILVGPAGLFNHLHYHDDDFETLFKVRADFDTRMERTPENEREYALFLAARGQQEGLRPFDRSAVAKMVEHGSRLAGAQRKLSARFGIIADLAREASYWAGQDGRDTVTAGDVVKARRERSDRSSLVEERERERFVDGSVSIDTSGEAIGQVNGLTTSRVADHRYGQPSRVAARTFAGGSGVTQIDREVNLAGPIHNKGVLTLAGYLGGQYSSKETFAFTAQLTFEQNYSDVDGDSASCAELYAILSSLANAPLKQSIAVTGTLNQRGQVQPIGAADEKIEGFFDLCAQRGLSGGQGVLIPAANQGDLNLREDVVQAVAEGKFHVWTVTAVDEGLELLTGQKPEEIHKKVRARLKELDSEGRGHHRQPPTWFARLRRWFRRVRRKASSAREQNKPPAGDSPQEETD